MGDENNYIFDYAKQVFCFEGKKYLKDELDIFKQDILKRQQNKNFLELYDFLKIWFDESPDIEVKTSGSTGLPKIIKANKIKMMQSAKRTCSFLGLGKNSSVLLCMPLQFIGSKMLVVRALVAGLDLYLSPPSLNPLKDIGFAFDFVSMTPQQVAVSIKNDIEKKRLYAIKHLLLGGMAIMPDLEKGLEHFPNYVWHGYGMTETLSHIALRKVNGSDKSFYFTPLEGIEISLDHDERILIKAPSICDQIIFTNDRAEISEEGTFKILGRVDNIINSGGIKIQIEEIEQILSKSIPIPFLVSSVSHAELGEQVVLLTEIFLPDWKERCVDLPKYHIPKLQITIPKLPMTDSNKPDRQKAKILAQKYVGI